MAIGEFPPARLLHAGGRGRGGIVPESSENPEFRTLFSLPEVLPNPQTSAQNRPAEFLPGLSEQAYPPEVCTGRFSTEEEEHETTRATLVEHHHGRRHGLLQYRDITVFQLRRGVRVAPAGVTTPRHR